MEHWQWQTILPTMETARQRASNKLPLQEATVETMVMLQIIMAISSKATPTVIQVMREVKEKSLAGKALSKESTLQR